MIQFTEQQKELNKQKEIRKHEDELVVAIQEALDRENSYGDLEESQFRNLVRVADTTDSVEVIKNFLRYQVGRYEKWGKGKDSLAEQIIKDIGVYDKGGKLIDLANRIATKSGYSDVRSIWLELIRRYLGYGARYLKYKRDGQS